MEKPKQWRALRDIVEDAAYGETGIVTMLRDGATVPDALLNAELLAACKALAALFDEQELVTREQLDFCMTLLYDIMKYGPFLPWVNDFGFEVTQALALE